MMCAYIVLLTKLNDVQTIHFSFHKLT